MQLVRCAFGARMGASAQPAIAVVSLVLRPRARTQRATGLRIEADGEAAEVTIGPMPLRRGARDEAEQAAGPDPGAAWTEALERYRSMSVPERAAEVLATVAPALAEYWDSAELDPRQRLHATNHQALLEHMLPATRVGRVPYRTTAELGVTLAEAFNALVLARLLIPYDYFVGGSQVLYSISADGLAALERGDVAEVVARRLPD